VLKPESLMAYSKQLPAFEASFFRSCGIMLVIINIES